MAAAPAPFPLHCNVCIKKPYFSDASHLLTHVSSKGHLAQYYKLELKAASDDQARADIEQYDAWYALNNVKKLVSERLSLKEAKRALSHTNQSQASVPAAAPSSKAPVSKKRKRAPTIVEAASLALDPALSLREAPPIDSKHSFGQLINPFFGDPYSTHPFVVNPFVSNQFTYETPQPKVKKPRLYLWSTKKPSFEAIPLPPGIFSSPPQAYYAPAKATVLTPMFPKTPQFHDDDQDDEELASEVTRLKGVYWPGMNIFDAATPDTKRKRNQKKHTSVALSLERQSTYVEANELIFTPTGTLRKSRPITGQAEQDSSPYKLDIPTPKFTKKRIPRPALAAKDTNASLRQSSRPSIPPTPFVGFGPISITDPRSTGARSNASKQSAKSSNKLGAHVTKRKREFSVFDDNDELEHDPNPHGSLGAFHQRSSASLTTPRMPVLTSGYTHSPYHPSPQFNPNPPRGSSHSDNRYSGHPGHAAHPGHPGHPLHPPPPPMYQNTYFQEAFEHYQPAMPHPSMAYSYPFYGYGYYAPPPGYEMAGYMPMPLPPPRQAPQTPINSNPARLGRQANSIEKDYDATTEPSHSDD